MRYLRHQCHRLSSFDLLNTCFHLKRRKYVAFFVCWHFAKARCHPMYTIFIEYFSFQTRFAVPWATFQRVGRPWICYIRIKTLNESWLIKYNVKSFDQIIYSFTYKKNKILRFMESHMWISMSKYIFHQQNKNVNKVQHQMRRKDGSFQIKTYSRIYSYILAICWNKE